jgi:RimJ/RimL family protein N-acetyltransferase
MNFIERVRGRANLGYWIRSSACGRGYATRATRLVTRFGFAVLAFTRVEIVVATANTASLRVAEKAGAQREGVMRNGIIIHGTPTDAVLYSLLPGEV